MRKFNLKENAAKRMIGMQKAGLSEKDAYADVPAEKAADTAFQDGIRIVWRTDIGRGVSRQEMYQQSTTRH